MSTETKPCGEFDDIRTLSGMTLSKSTVEMIVNEYEFDPRHSQETNLYGLLCDLAKSHEVLRAELDRTAKANETRIASLEREVKSKTEAAKWYHDAANNCAEERDAARAALEDRDEMHADHVQSLEAERLRLAAKIELLTKENERLRSALNEIADVNAGILYPTRSVSYADWELRRIARKALE